MRSPIARLVVLLLFLIALTGQSLPASAVQTPLPNMVSANPVNTTPHVLDGAVRAVVQIGSTVVVGGTFTSIAPADRSVTVTRPNIFAFDAATGAILDGFAPTVDGEVMTLLASPDDASVVIGGRFITVNGVRSKSLAKLALSTGLAVPGFRVPPLNGVVQDLRFAGSRLLLSGNFTKVGPVARGAVAAVNPLTGARDDSVDLRVAGPRNGGALQVAKMDVAPDGRTLVIIGNFTSVQEQVRTQIALVDLTAAPAAVTGWSTTRFEPLCAAKAFDTYLRDVDISQDGSFFVIVTTGGPSTGTLCDTASRWEIGPTTPNQQPTWVNVTGGDTLTAAAVAGPIVYIGGHQRWLNNSFGRNTAGPGAVSRDGLAALDVRNGLPLTWNPGRTRGVGVFDMYTTGQGLWATSDTDRFAREFHGRLAFFPVAKGTELPPEVTGQLPGAVVLGGPYTPATGYGDGASYRWFDGAASTSVTRAIPAAAGWSSVRGATMIDSEVFSGTSDGRLQVRTVQGAGFGLPTDVPLNNLTAFSTELRTMTGMAYDRRTGRLYFSLSGSTTLYYRYFSPQSRVVGADRFTVPSVTGLDTGTIAGMFMVGNVLYAARGSDGALQAVTLESTGLVAGSVRVVSSPAIDGRDWRARALLVRTDSALAQPQAPTAGFTVACTRLSCAVDASPSQDADGSITRWSWTFGDGSSGIGQATSHTYAAPGARTITLTVTDNEGMTTSTTRDVVVSNNAPPTALLAVDCELRTCTADVSGSSDPEGTALRADLDWGDGTVVTVAGGQATHEYGADASFDVRLAVTDADGAVATASQSVTVAANKPPVADLQTWCGASSCRLSAQGSRDPDGAVAATTIDMGDGTVVTGGVATHTYAAGGQYTVTATVTDNRGAATSTSRQVSVGTDVPGIAFRAAARSSGSGTKRPVTVPAQVRAGDGLLMFASTNTATPVATPDGWGLVDTVIIGSLTTSLFSRAALDTDAGTTVVLTSPTIMKVDAQLLAYSGTAADPVAAFAGVGSAEVTQLRAAPDVPVPDPRGWVVSYWADKSSVTTDWTAPDGSSVRGESIGIGSGRVTSLVVDGAAPAGPGTTPGLSAASDAAGARATTWSVALRPGS